MTSGGIVVVAEHLRGELADVTLEMLSCGREIAESTQWSVTCVLLTSDPNPFKALPLAANRVILLQDSSLQFFNPEAYAKVLVPILKELSPRLVLMGNTSMGMDLVGSLSRALGARAISGCIRVQVEGGVPSFTSKLYGGKLLAQSETSAEPAIVLMMPGSYPKEGGMKNEVPPMEVRAAAPGASPKIRFREFIEPKVEDVDVRKVAVLIAAGRGVQSKENVLALEELAKILGGAVCATRPVVDQGWLPRSRQIGRSGMIVKPRLYLALGISGAPEHVEGMKESELIVAVNTDADAPIFDVAHFGAQVDLLDLVPVLTEKLEAVKPKP